jgi:hypothetical protein
MPGQRSPDVIQVNLRLPKAMHKRLVAAAESGGRSLNAEMVARLEQTFRRERADQILAEAQMDVNEAKRINDLTASNLAELQEAIRTGQSIDDVVLSPHYGLLRRKKK